MERQGEAGAIGPDSRDSVLPCQRQEHVERCVLGNTEEGAEHYSFCTGACHHEFQSRQGTTRQVLMTCPQGRKRQPWFGSKANGYNAIDSGGRGYRAHATFLSHTHTHIHTHTVDH